MLLGCGEAVPPRSVLELDARPGTGDRGSADRWRFGDGAVVSGLVVPSQPVVPGGSVSVAFDVSVAGQFEVSVSPPRAAAREVALGGPGAPPPTVPADARTRSVRVQGKGHLEVEIPLAAPWHPHTAIVTLRRFRGTRTSPVVEGPRRRDGVGVLAIVDVVPTPTTAP